MQFWRGVNARQVRGDSRTEELAAKNDKEIQPEPEEITEYAETHLIHIFNVSPYSHKIDHPSIGSITIPACEKGQRYSKPAIIKGTMPYGVPTEMTVVEIRRDSGRLFALDLLGLGPFRDQRNSLLSQGCFISSGDTLDMEDLVEYRMAPKVKLNVPRWVKSGKSPEKPTESRTAGRRGPFCRARLRKDRGGRSLLGCRTGEQGRRLEQHPHRAPRSSPETRPAPSVGSAPADDGRLPRLRTESRAEHQEASGMRLEIRSQLLRGRHSARQPEGRRAAESGPIAL